jgi:hypothetical protein
MAGHFVLHNLDPGAVAGDDAISLFDRADAANIEADAGVELSRLCRPVSFPDYRT